MPIPGADGRYRIHRHRGRAPKFLREAMRGAIAEDMSGAARRADGELRTIDELLELAAEEGTLSTLDIETVSMRRAFGAAAPVPDKVLRRFFGTDRPTHQQVERSAPDLTELLDRLQAYYLVVYRELPDSVGGREPVEYAFIGCTGD